MNIWRITDKITDQVTRPFERMGETIGESFEPVVRLGVTGLSRAGKTVFITSLVANLLDRERMGALSAVRDGRLDAVALEPQPDPTLARFDYERHLDALLAKTPTWPESTRNISELRLSFRVNRSGFMGIGGGPRVVHLDIIDYPGEWLLDLGLTDMDFETWSGNILSRLAENPVVEGPEGEHAFIEMIDQIDPSAPYDEALAQDLSRRFHDLVKARKRAGQSDIVPGRFLLPAELEGSPAITFCPLPLPVSASRRSLGRAFSDRFAAYKRHVVEPFFKDHFSRLDRQIVLIDVLGALDRGPSAVGALEDAMQNILRAFKPGSNGFFSFLTGRKIDRMAFVATKADQLHHSQHDELVDLTEALVEKAHGDARFAGAGVSAKALASVRATVEDTRQHQGQTLNIVRGNRAEDGKPVGFYFGNLPKDAESFLSRAGKIKEWPEGSDFGLIGLRPPDLSARKRGGVPHIRLDQLVEFLIGDKL